LRIERIGDAVLYLGDCREVLPTLGKVDAVITDPPYGIALETAYRLRGRGRLAKCHDFSEIHGDDKPFDPVPLFAACDRVITWGANYYASKLQDVSGWLVWDKRVLDISNDQADGELAWTNCVKGVRVFRHMWNGFLRDSERGEGFHPTQKPVALMDWCLGLINPASVLDPYMGSGPVGVACVRRGVPYTGIEIEPKYFDIACRRINDAYRQKPLFAPEEATVPLQAKLEWEAH
jgi:site-specific DNA-methyltransferase (adenine-specific)/modification methylase